MVVSLVVLVEDSFIFGGGAPRGRQVAFFLFSLMSELIVLLTNIYSVWLVLIVI